jgi:LPXTG-motif cell wall-anchored protein
MFMAVTSLADTFPMKGNLDRDYSRDFAEVVLATSRKLQGRVREYRDTVIGNQPGYISRQEVRLQGGDKAYYDLVQVLHQDSIRGFSSQYLIGDKQAEAATARFFGSIRMAAPSEKGKTGPVLGYWLAGGLVLLGGAWFLLRKRRN